MVHPEEPKEVIPVQDAVAELVVTLLVVAALSVGACVQLEEELQVVT